MVPLSRSTCATTRSSRSVITGSEEVIPPSSASARIEAQRGAQLVGQLRGEPLLVRGSPPRPGRADRRGVAQPGQLVVALAQVEPGLQVVLAPLGGEIGHPLDRSQGAPYRPGRDRCGQRGDQHPQRGQPGRPAGSGCPRRPGRSPRRRRRPRASARRAAGSGGPGRPGRGAAAGSARSPSTGCPRCPAPARRRRDRTPAGRGRRRPRPCRSRRRHRSGRPAASRGRRGRCPTGSPPAGRPADASIRSVVRRATTSTTTRTIKPIAATVTAASSGRCGYGRWNARVRRRGWPHWRTYPTPRTVSRRTGDSTSASLTRSRRT